MFNHVIDRILGSYEIYILLTSRNSTHGPTVSAAKRCEWMQTDWWASFVTHGGKRGLVYRSPKWDMSPLNIDEGLNTQVLPVNLELVISSIATMRLGAK